MTNLGSNLAIDQPPVLDTRPVLQAVASEPYVSTAELAECNCPEYCERDHDRD